MAIASRDHAVFMYITAKWLRVDRIGKDREKHGIAIKSALQREIAGRWKSVPTVPNVKFIKPVIHCFGFNDDPGSPPFVSDIPVPRDRSPTPASPAPSNPRKSPEPPSRIPQKSPRSGRKSKGQ